MKINLQSLKFTARPDLVDFVQKKVSKLERFDDKIISAEVKLWVLDGQRGDNKACDIMLVVPGRDVLVKRNSFTFEQAVLDAVDTLQNKLTKQKSERMHTA